MIWLPYPFIQLIILPWAKAGAHDNTHGKRFKWIVINTLIRILASITRNPETFLNQYPFNEDESLVRFIKGELLTFEYPAGSF